MSETITAQQALKQIKSGHLGQLKGLDVHDFTHIFYHAGEVTLQTYYLSGQATLAEVIEEHEKEIRAYAENARGVMLQLVCGQGYDLTIEEAHVMLLNQNYKLIKEMRVSQGGLTEVSVDVRMIIKEAVLNNSSVLAFIHNHPSGNIHPSTFDDKLTQTLKKACELMRIHFLDHVIVCDGDFYSYHERGRL